MGQFLQVNGDYNIKAGDGAKITLDTGPVASGGSVRVTGDLIIEGNTVSVAATNLDVEDNIITLNYGETGPGVTLLYSGIEVDRGNTASVDPSLEPQSNSSFVWDEANNTWIIAQGSSPGPFNYEFSNLKLRKILTNSVTDNGDLTLIGTGTGVVKVGDRGGSGYETFVTDPDDIPNKQYVDDAILNNPTFQIVAPSSQNTKVVIADKELEAAPPDPSIPGSPAYLTATTTHSSFGESAVTIVVDGFLSGQFYPNRFEVGDLEIGGGVDRNEITNKASVTNENIIIRTQGTGKVVFNYALQIDRIGTSGETPPTAFPYTPLTPSYVSGSTLLYAGSASIGNTGLYFVNDTIDASGAPGTGELISKNKALVFSMLF
jgi:hypothetical protein